MSDTYEGNAAGGINTNPAPGPGIFPEIDIPGNGGGLDATAFTSPYETFADFIEYLKENTTANFGTGRDGNQTYSDTHVDLLNDVEYQNLTLDHNASIYTNGFRIYVNNTLTIRDTSNINCNGADAYGTIGGGGSQIATVYGGFAGGDGNINSSGDDGSDNSTDISLTKPFAIISNGGGGNGATAAGGFGGDGGSNDVATPDMGRIHSYSPLLLGALVSPRRGIKRICGGAGGGAGGASGTGGSTGGGGGAGAGVLSIAARRIVLDTTLNIQCIGGAGGLGEVGMFGSGGGGEGGTIILMYGSLTIVDNSNIISDINCAGGSGGGGSLPGSDGDEGIIIKIGQPIVL